MISANQRTQGNKGRKGILFLIPCNPLLFLIYINDLPNSSKLLNFFLFADDTNIYFESDDPTRLSKTVNKELKKVKSWLDCNKLALNIEKTNFVLFHSPRKKLPNLMNLKFGKCSIKKTKYVKFLGVLVDEHLSWKYHINELYKKLSRTTGIFFKIRHYIPIETLICLYNSLFSSFLSYGIIVWGRGGVAKIKGTGKTRRKGAHDGLTSFSVHRNLVPPFTILSMTCQFMIPQQ